MGHRALHAVERQGGSYDCYRSTRDGLAVFEGSLPSVQTVLRDCSRVAAGISPMVVLALVDPLGDEALFVHGREGTAAYLVCRLGVPTVSQEAARAPWTALVPVAGGEAARRLDSVLRAAQAVLGDAVDAGLLTRRAAEAYLGTFVARHPDVPPETLWLEPG